MSDLKEPVFERVLARRAKRLGISKKAARVTGSGKLFYVAAAESAAARLGKSAEAVLQDDLRRVEDSKYPSADCLTPDDLEGLIDYLQETDISLVEAIEPRKIASSKSINSPWTNALSHLTGCDPCRTLLSACLPSETRKQEFDTFLEKTFRRAVAHS